MDFNFAILGRDFDQIFRTNRLFEKNDICRALSSLWEKRHLGIHLLSYSYVTSQPRVICTYQCHTGRGRRQGMGWEFDCPCWPCDGAFDWSCSPRGGDIWIFLRPTWTYFTADSDEIDWGRTYVSPLPCNTHAPYGQEKSGKHGGQREQAKAEWISLFCLQISFVLACFWSIEPLKILWYQSKRK